MRNNCESKLHKEYISYRKSSSIIAKKIQLISQSSSIDRLNTISKEVLAISYPTIKLCSTYPDRIPETYIEKRVKGISDSRNMLKFPPSDYRFHIAMISCFNLMVRYVRKGRLVNIQKFMLFNLPLYYINELSKENKDIRWPILVPSYSVEPGFNLPECGKDYINNFVNSCFYRNILSAFS